VSAAERRPEPGWYEITVVGPVGPVLRQALEPCRTGPVQLQTIVRAHVRADVDLVELAQRFRAQGATVTEIVVLDARELRGKP
jgi:hypothetical protein